MSNALRHSQATEINVKIDISDTNVHVSVDDNGKGIDMEKRRIDLARSIAADFQIDVPFEISDAAGLSRLGETFDVIIMGEILEHFFEPWKILEEIAVLCRPGTVLIATTPNMSSLHGRLKLFFLGMFPDHNPEHLFFYTRRRFREMLKKSPFEMVTCRTILPMLIPNLGPLTSVERLFWRGVNFMVRGIGEHLIVVCTLRGEPNHSGL